MRKNSKKVDLIIIIVILLLIVVGVLFALLSDNGQKNDSGITADKNGDGIITYTDYIGKRVGIITGSSFEDPKFEFLPDSDVSSARLCACVSRVYVPTHRKQARERYKQHLCQAPARHAGSGSADDTLL